MAQQRADDAIQLLQAEAKKNPTRLEYHLNIGNLAMRAARYELAIQEFLTVLNRIDKYSRAAGDLYFRIGEAYRRKGDQDFSVIMLRQAKELLPGNTVVLATLALALEKGGQKEAAAREYKSALDADPNNAAALNNLAFLLCENGGDLDVALKCAMRARELQPDSQGVADTLGWIYVKKNMTDQAIGILRAVVKDSPARSTPHYHLGVALKQKGELPAAIEELKAALKYNPANDEERQINELLQKIDKPD
jgi:tetratricopeptide (TPR) repeat protein